MEFSITVDLINVPDEKYQELLDVFMKKMKEMGKFSFEELNEMFHISKRNYISASIDMPDINSADVEDGKWRFPKTTRIDIRG